VAEVSTARVSGWGKDASLGSDALYPIR